jgi:predicted alpha/beta superfamily hydrolase
MKKRKPIFQNKKISLQVQIEAMKRMAVIIMSLAPVIACAQYKVKLEITRLPATPAPAVIYITGNFNGWNPQDENGRLQKNDNGSFFAEINGVAAGTYEFKFTRGSWDNVETDVQGKDISNRVVTVQSDTVLAFSIAGWKDGFAVTPTPQRKSTASPQVAIIDTAFAMPLLGRTRRIWLYLPKDYTASNKQYPVLYMHDGQNLFDDATSFAGEWGIDEAMDSVRNACIVVGIDNAGVKRMNEYNPHDAEQFGKGEGKEYLAFIVKNLKPYIDKRYRTLKDKKHTWIAGSSMGGLISFYAGLYYPDVFGGLGVFSPSFWIVPHISDEIKQLAKKNIHGSQKYYFYMGEKEGKEMLTGMKAVINEMKLIANPETGTVINPDGKHNEPSWRVVFPVFYAWLVK